MNNFYYCHNWSLSYNSQQNSTVKLGMSLSALPLTNHAHIEMSDSEAGVFIIFLKVLLRDPDKWKMNSCLSFHFLIPCVVLFLDVIFHLSNIFPVFLQFSSYFCIWWNRLLLKWLYLSVFHLWISLVINICFSLSTTALSAVFQKQCFHHEFRVL